MTAHQKPEVKRSRTAPMTTPDKIEDEDEHTNGIDINVNLTSMNTTQQNARAYPGGNQRKSEKKMRQLRQLLSTNEGPGTADEKQCTQQQDDIIHDEKNNSTTTPVTPTVVTKVETCDCPRRASLLINSHGAAELPDDALHLRPWDVWIKQISNQNNCKESRLQPEKTSITLLHVILLQPRFMHWLQNGWSSEQSRVYLFIEITESPSRRAGY